MTDRIKGLTVTLERDIREDDAQAIIDAIKMAKGVLGVEAHVADYDHHMAYAQARRDMEMKILRILKED